MTTAEYCVHCGAQALRDQDGELQGWAATIAMDPDCDHDFRAERTVTVKGWLARYQVRQHLELHGIGFTEDRGDLSSTFTVEASDAQWDGIQQAKKEAER